MYAAVRIHLKLHVKRFIILLRISEFQENILSAILDPATLGAIYYEK